MNLYFIISILANIAIATAISCACTPLGNGCAVAIDKCGGKFPYAVCVQPNPPFSNGCGVCNCWASYLGPMAANKSDIDCICSRRVGEGCLYDCECCEGLCQWAQGFKCGYDAINPKEKKQMTIAKTFSIRVNYTTSRITINDHDTTTKIFTWSNSWNIGNVVTLSKQSLHVNSDGTMIYNYWIDSVWRTNCEPKDGCQHMYLSATLYNNNGAVIDNRDLLYLESCAHGARENTGKFDNSEYNLITGATIFVTASKGFIC